MQMTHAAKRPKTSKKVKSKKRKVQESEDDAVLQYSGLFTLQLDDFVREVTLEGETESSLSDFVERVSQCLLKAKPSEYSHELSDRAWLDKLDLSFPLPFDRVPQNATEYQFRPPTAVDVIGSFGCNASTKGPVTVDLAVQMPEECLGPRDYMNEAYFYKRAFYLCSCAYKLRRKMNKKISKMEFERFMEDPRRPALVIVPAGLENCQIRLLPYPPSDVFKLGRFHPSTSNIRPTWYFGESSSNEFPPTPVYNNALLSDLLLVSTHQNISQHLKTVSIRKALVLLRIWLKNRCLSEGVGAFTNFLLSAWMAYLSFNGHYKPSMSVTQIMRTTLAQFGKISWLSESVSFNSEPAGDENFPQLDDFKKHFDLVFVDSTGYMNLATHLTLPTYDRLLYEAKLTVSQLDSQDSKTFEILFMRQMPFLLSFDHIFHIYSCDEMRQYYEGRRQLWKSVDHCSDYARTIKTELFSLIKMSLGERAVLIDMRRCSQKSWSIDCAPPAVTTEKLTFGLLLDSNQYSAVLERGPAANSPEAEQFRKLWGEKSDLRKFADSIISEAVVWDAQTDSQKRLVPQQIVTYVLKVHMKIPSNCVKYIASQLESVLHIDSNPKQEGVEHITAAYDKLAKSLRLVEGLPLGVAHVQPVSASLRDTEPFIPTPCDSRHITKFLQIRGDGLVPRLSANRCPVWCPSAKIQLNLETSGKWPDDIDAIRRLKSAFYIQLAELLKEQFKLCTMALSDKLFVIQDDFVFEIIIAYQREISLLTVLESESGPVQSKHNEKSRGLEKEISLKPKLAAWLNSLSQQHQCFGLSCRLAKRWISCQLLSDFVQEEAIELMMAYLFVSPQPFAYPNGALCAFVRFLHLLSSFDWLRMPLVVNFNQQLSAEELVSLENEFLRLRPTLPSMCIYTPDDKCGYRWTRPHPMPVIVHRITKLAHNSAQLMLEMMDQQTDTDGINSAFTPSLDCYDAVITLHHPQLPRRSHTINIQEETEKKEMTNPKVPVVDFDPLELFIRNIKEKFNNLALFFYDKYAGDTIGVLWRPKTTSKKSENIDLESVLDEMGVLGKGLVKSISR